MIDLSAFVGFGIIAVLLKMNHTLGKLCSKMDISMKTSEDHEGRIRTLEKKP